jgi:hypothetical protein
VLIETPQAAAMSLKRLRPLPVRVIMRFSRLDRDPAKNFHVAQSLPLRNSGKNRVIPSLIVIPAEAQAKSRDRLTRKALSIVRRSRVSLRPE